MLPLLMVAGLGTGCAALKTILVCLHLPSIFDGLQVNHVSFQDVDTEFVFATDNPNPVGIDIDVAYSLFLRMLAGWMEQPRWLLLGASGVKSIIAYAYCVL